jgi:VWFA-related protein
VKFLARTVNIESPTSLVVLGRKGLRVLHDFTSNAGLLVTALRRASSELNETHVPPPAAAIHTLNEAAYLEADPRSIFQTIESLSASTDVPYKQAQAIEQTMEAFQHLAQSFSGIPGRKALIWATAAFPFTVTEDTGIVGQGQPSSLYERTMQMLNHANMAIYPVDVRGLVYFAPSQMELATRATGGGQTGLVQAQQTASPSSRLGGTAGPSDYHGPTQAATISTMEMFASMTGGRAFYNRNDLDTSFEEAAKDSVSYYLLGYQLDTSNKRSGWRKLKVEVKQADARVRSRNGFFVTPVTEDPKYSHDVDIFNALESPLDYTVVPFSVRWLEVKQESGRLKAKFQITVSPTAVTIDETDGNRVEIEIVGVARDSKGESASDPFSATVKANLSPEQLAQVRSGGVIYKDEISVPAGDYNVRFVVRDNLSGRTGSLLARLGTAQTAKK